MTLHRFYVEDVHDKSGQLELDHQIWIHDEALLKQWLRVLRFNVGDQLILFNLKEERIYTIKKIEFPNSILLEMVTELNRKLPANHVYLLWSLLKKDKNEWVIQKATEMGVKNLVPIIAERSEKTDINIERARKIIIEAVEQCGRSDIPDIREPIGLKEALEEYSGIELMVCEQNVDVDDHILPKTSAKIGILIGPEGGWSESEGKLFKDRKLAHINISQFTLRAETAAVAALTIVLSK
jgi:16S rRNA (uracil1498-N3)-methyltransferase